MKRNTLWALEIPDLHPLGFTHCGDKRIRLYWGGDGGGDGGDGGDGGSGDVGDVGDVGDAIGAGATDASLGAAGEANAAANGVIGADATDMSLGAAGLANAINSAMDSTAFNDAMLANALQSGNPAAVVAALQGQLSINPAEAQAMANQGLLSTGVGLTQSELGLLSGQGLGNTSISENQTVDQALNSFAVHGFLNDNIGTIMGQLTGVPALGTAVSIMSGLAQGQSVPSVIGQAVVSALSSAITNATGISVSPSALTSLANGQVGQAAFGIAIGEVAQATGIPASAINAALSGNLGAAAANAMTSAVVGEMAQAMTGPFGQMTAQAIASSPIAQDAAQSIANAINNNSIANSINQSTGNLSQSITNAGIGIPDGLGITSGIGSVSPSVTPGNATSDGLNAFGNVFSLDNATNNPSAFSMQPSLDLSDLSGLLGTGQQSAQAKTNQGAQTQTQSPFGSIFGEERTSLEEMLKLLGRG